MLEPNLTPAQRADRPALPAEISEPGVIAIGRRLVAESSIEIAQAIAQGGIRAFEITLNEPVTTALEGIERLNNAFGNTMLIGAGTVLSVDAGQRAVDAGAGFLVTPHVDQAIIGWAVEHGVPIIPGGFTPTEIQRAWQAGATAVKLFPASVATASAVREMRGPFPDIPLIPTGGVALDAVGEFIRAGSVAVGLGSWLFAERRLDIVAARAAMAVRAVQEARAAARGGLEGAVGDSSWGRSL